MSNYLHLGKLGDVIQVLPIAYHDFQTTGIKPKFIISRDYAEILEGVSYVEPVIFDGGFADLKPAIRFAKEKFDDVHVLQTHGNDFPIERKTTSFQLDTWARAGCVEHFNDWPLVFDRRNPKRERELLHATLNRTEGRGRPFEKFVLLADHSESSPFNQIEELAELLKRISGKTHRLIRMSEIRAEKPFDVLALYDRATCLITPETMHSHLCKASPVPTLALAADGWRGIAPHKKFMFYCSFNQWPQQKHQLLAAYEKIINGTAKVEVNSAPRTVSAVIPIYKPTAEMLNRCLTAVLPQVAEVIITREIAGVVPKGVLEGSKIKHVVHQGVGIGFSANINHGAWQAKGDCLLLLNDDVYLSPDAVEKMLLELKDGVAAVGPLLRYPNGTIYCGGKKFSGPHGGHIDYHQMTPTIVVPTQMEDMNGAAMLVDKKAFEKVGGFDEEYRFYLSDDDLAMKFTKAGYKLIYTPYATAIHDGHQETKQAPFNVMDEQKKAQARFTQKWGGK